MSTIIYPFGTVEFTITAGEYATISALEGDAKIYLGVDDPNMPMTYSYSQTLDQSQVTLGTYSADKAVRVENGPGKVFYDTGATPSISQYFDTITPAGTTSTTSGILTAGGLFALNTAQVIDMNDATVQLTVDTGALAGTLLTSNILMVDANSSGTEDLELPPEAAAAGLVLWIYNTGGESIVVKDDAGAVTIDTIATTEWGVVFCDGTSWHGMNVA